MKYLIGITPQGTVYFISKGWGGRTSDKHLTERSGFLDHLNPGDVRLADRGFDVADSVGLYNAELKIPAFTRGKKQLGPVELGSTRGLASVGYIRKELSVRQGISTPYFKVQLGFKCVKLSILKVLHL